MVRRTLLVACTVLLLWAAPAAAQSYGDVVAQNQSPGVRFDTGQVFVFETVITEDRGVLALTGSDNVVPLVQGGLVLIGGGSLLALVARRRRAQRRTDTA